MSIFHQALGNVFLIFALILSCCNLLTALRNRNYHFRRYPSIFYICSLLICQAGAAIIGNIPISGYQKPEGILFQLISKVFRFFSLCVQAQRQIKRLQLPPFVAVGLEHVLYHLHV